MATEALLSVEVGRRAMPGLDEIDRMGLRSGILVTGRAVVTLAAIVIVISVIPPESVDSLAIDPFMDKVTVAVSENASIISDVLQNPVLLLIGASLTLLSLIAGYYLFDSHKSFKKRLNTVTH